MRKPWVIQRNLSTQLVDSVSRDTGHPRLCKDSPSVPATPPPPHSTPSPPALHALLGQTFRQLQNGPLPSCPSSSFYSHGFLIRSLPSWTTLEILNGQEAPHCTPGTSFASLLGIICFINYLRCNGKLFLKNESGGLLASSTVLSGSHLFCLFLSGRAFKGTSQILRCSAGLVCRSDGGRGKRRCFLIPRGPEGRGKQRQGQDKGYRLLWTLLVKFTLLWACMVIQGVMHFFNLNVFISQCPPEPKTAFGLLAVWNYLCLFYMRNGMLMIQS